MSAKPPPSKVGAHTKPEKLAADGASPTFSFFKGDEDVLVTRGPKPFEWEAAAAMVRQHLSDALNASNISFLLGSGCSSLLRDGKQVGIPTMAPMASEFVGTVGKDDDPLFTTEAERQTLLKTLGLKIVDEEYTRNLERLMETLLGFERILPNSTKADFKSAAPAVQSVIKKITRYITERCTVGAFSLGDDSLLGLYQAFYRKLVYRDRSLPKPWVFTTNYDLFNETAMDRLSVPYSNGFSGSVERRFNPSTFRYALAEQLDLSARKWTSVDNFIYLCKLHGSISWVEDRRGLFPIRELASAATGDKRVMIYPTPAKQNSSLGSPYSDLFREFQTRIVRDQSVLVVLGYSFSDEHINNIIFQALTVPNFRLVIFSPADTTGVLQTLRELGDPRIWMIGGEGPTSTRKAHYFDVFVEKFMPEPPGDRVDTAIKKVLENLLGGKPEESDET